LTPAPSRTLSVPSTCVRSSWLSAVAKHVRKKCCQWNLCASWASCAPPMTCPMAKCMRLGQGKCSLGCRLSRCCTCRWHVRLQWNLLHGCYHSPASILLTEGETLLLWHHVSSCIIVSNHQPLSCWLKVNPFVHLLLHHSILWPRCACIYVTFCASWRCGCFECSILTLCFHAHAHTCTHTHICGHRGPLAFPFELFSLKPA
jgi:hypothetical protein